MDFTQEFSQVNGYDPANPQPGFYPDVPNDVYHSADIITKSKLDDIHESLSTFVQRRKAPRKQEKMVALDYGSAAHCYFLERERFNTEYAVMPSYNLRTNKGKDDKAKFERDNADKMIITSGDLEQIKFMVESMNAHPVLSHWISHKGWSEPTIVVELEGVMVQVRPDKLVEHDRFVVVPDLKFAETMAKFEKDFFNYRYDVQAALYSDAVAKHFDKPCLFVFGVCAKQYECGMIPVDAWEMVEADIIEGREAYQADMEKYRKAKESGSWLETRKIKRWRKS